MPREGARRGPSESLSLLVDGLKSITAGLKPLISPWGVIERVDLIAFSPSFKNVRNSAVYLYSPSSGIQKFPTYDLNYLLSQTSWRGPSARAWDERKRKKRKGKERRDGQRERKKIERQRSSVRPLYFLTLLGGPMGSSLVEMRGTLLRTSPFDNLLTISVILTRSLWMDNPSMRAFLFSTLVFYSRLVVKLFLSEVWDVLQ